MASGDKKKITANIWEYLIGPLNGKLASACLLRDAYLDVVLWKEAELLEKEMPQANTPEAKRYLSKQLKLKEFKRTPVSFSLSESTVKAMDEACSARRIPRDSFINRVILLLLVADKPKFFTRYLGVNVVEEYGMKVREKIHREQCYPDFFSGGTNVISELLAFDPFFAIRACIEEAIIDFKANSLSDSAPPLLHTMMISIESKDTGLESKAFNCYLNDRYIEGHEKNIEWKKQVDDLFRTLDL